MICITGAGGTVGREVVRSLKEANLPFKAAYFSDYKVKQAKAEGIDATIIDYNNVDTLVSAFNNCDKVFLLGPNVENQSELEINVVKAAKIANVDHIIKLSSTNADKESYKIGEIHSIVEKAIKRSGLRYTFLRCNQYMQNLVTFAAQTIKEENVVYSASADAKISQLDVRDIAKVIIYILQDEKHINKEYSLTGPDAFSYDELAYSLSHVLGREINHINLSPEDYKNGMISEGVSEEIADRLIDLERYFREGEPAEISNDIKTITGDTPRNYINFIKEISKTGVWG